MLSNRIITVQLNSRSARAVAARGCPQGGVLSPLLWSLVVDGLLVELNSIGIYTQAYADDVVVLCPGPVVRDLRGPMNRALSVIDRWCRDEGLGVNPDKVELVLFTRKRKRVVLPEITLAGKTLEYKTTVKYQAELERTL